MRVWLFLIMCALIFTNTASAQESYLFEVKTPSGFQDKQEEVAVFGGQIAGLFIYFDSDLKIKDALGVKADLLIQIPQHERLFIVFQGRYIETDSELNLPDEGVRVDGAFAGIKGGLERGVPGVFEPGIASMDYMICAGIYRFIGEYERDTALAISAEVQLNVEAISPTLFISVGGDYLSTSFQQRNTRRFANAFACIGFRF